MTFVAEASLPVGGASVMHGMVSMGVSLIPLCCSSLTLCSAICVALALGSVRIVLILDWSSLVSLCPFVKWYCPKG